MNNFKSKFANCAAALASLLLILSFSVHSRASVQRLDAKGSDGGGTVGAKEQQVAARSDARKNERGAASSEAANAHAVNADHYKIGQAHYEAKRYKEAIDAYVQALRAKPDDAKIHFDLGLAYYGLSRYKEAAATFERAARLKPEWDEAHYRLGWAYYVLGKRVPSLEQYKILQKLNPQLAGVLARILRLENAAAATDAAATAKAAGANKTQTSLLPAGIANNSDTVVVVMRPAPVLDAPPPPANTISPIDAGLARSEMAATADQNARPAASGGEQLPTETYRLGVGDVLDIRLPDSKRDASSLYTVMAGGVLEYPLASVSLIASGMTTDELVARLTVELKRRAISENPQVTVKVRDYASHKVTINGLVSYPGLRFLRREATPLYVVLAEAQPKPEAGRATIMRAGGQSTEIDLSDQAAMNTLVHPGEVIDVLARAPKFYFIGGQIQQPGQKIFENGMTLMQAILTAGGVVRASAGNVVELSRAGADGRLTTTKIALKEIKSGKVPDPRLQAGDLIEVVQ